MKINKCIFCQLQHDKDLIILENSFAYVIKDKYPVRKGHLLIIPKNHYPTYFETPFNVLNELFSLLNEAKKWLEFNYKPTGFRIQINCEKDGMQEIFHTHIHLIPAYKDNPFVKFINNNNVLK